MTANTFFTMFIGSLPDRARSGCNAATGMEARWWRIHLALMPSPDFELLSFGVEDARSSGKTRCMSKGAVNEVLPGDQLGLVEVNAAPSEIGTDRIEGSVKNGSSYVLWLVTIRVTGEGGAGPAPKSHEIDIPSTPPGSESRFSLRLPEPWPAGAPFKFIVEAAIGSRPKSATEPAPATQEGSKGADSGEAGQSQAVIPETAAKKASATGPVAAVVASLLALGGGCAVLLVPIGIVMGVIYFRRGGRDGLSTHRSLGAAAIGISVVATGLFLVKVRAGVPEMIQFQGRAKQYECRRLLADISNAQRVQMNRSGKFAASFEALGISAPDFQRYSYVLDPQVPGGILARDTARFGELKQPIPKIDAAGEQIGVFEDHFTVICVGDIDDDPEVDVWSVSSGNRTIDGVMIPGGEIYNDVPDVPAKLESSDGGMRRPSPAWLSLRPSGCECSIESHNTPKVRRKSVKDDHGADHGLSIWEDEQGEVSFTVVAMDRVVGDRMNDMDRVEAVMNGMAKGSGSQVERVMRWFPEPGGPAWGELGLLAPDAGISADAKIVVGKSRLWTATVWYPTDQGDALAVERSHYLEHFKISLPDGGSWTAPRSGMLLTVDAKGNVKAQPWDAGP